MEKEIKERDFYFDNIKSLMIFLVVLGHFLELGLYNNDIFKMIWFAIYLFHMPIFIFVTGYYTKCNQLNIEKAVKNYLIPYIVFSLLLYFFRMTILNENIIITILNPQYAMWFLLSIFSYKIIYNGVYKIPRLFEISIILAVIIGFDKSVTNFGALSRTIVYFPFFIAGTRFKKESLIRNIKKLKYIKYSFYLILPLILITFSYICIKLKIPMDLLRSSVPYAFLNVPIEVAMLGRTCILILAFIVIYIILNIIPNKKICISYIGQNTIVTYLLHIFIILYFEKANMLDGESYETFILSVIMTILTVYITSLPILKRIYDSFIKKIAIYIYGNG